VNICEIKYTQYNIAVSKQSYPDFTLEGLKNCRIKLLTYAIYLTSSCMSVASVATSPLALRWICGSPQKKCAHGTTPIYMWREQATLIEWARYVIFIVACCHCEALRTCDSGILIATKWCCDQDVKVVPGATFIKKMCDQCGSLKKEGNVVATSPLAFLWMHISPRMECARRTKPIYTWCEQAMIERTRCVISIALAAIVWSFAHLPLGLSDRNTC